MSKHNQVSIHNEEEETRQLKREMISSFVWNVLFLALLFVLFFIDQATGLIDNFFARLFKF
ncbi:MAG: hypothetical protein HYW51_00600 [Candidatus Doudnabacteria bacterium]|nr:hypothetical protein [Candidatus Doudnabacteria bacterium]